jgi:hypothetical protein
LRTTISNSPARISSNSRNSSALSSVTMAPRRGSSVASPSRSRMRSASRIGPRLTENSSASSCSPMRPPGAIAPERMRSPTRAAICSETVSVGSTWSANSRKATAPSQGLNRSGGRSPGFMAASIQVHDHLVVGHRLAFGDQDLGDHARGRALIGISIFIDSTMTSVSPSLTDWPRATSTFQTLPVISDRTLCMTTPIIVDLQIVNNLVKTVARENP